nr:unnamed protein product [Callosobruchus analis]
MSGKDKVVVALVKKAVENDVTDNSDNRLKRLEKMTYLIILQCVGLVVGKSFSAFLNFEQ